MTTIERPRPVILIILDGWGYSEETAANAVQAAHLPVWNALWHKYPHTLLRASGAEVGLPGGQMGNSEVGHLNLGAGRVVYQEFTRVSRALKTGSFYTNATLTEAVDEVVHADKALHILGLLSPGGVHSHEKNIHAMAELAVQRGAERVYIHTFLDGRDTPPKSAAQSLQLMEDKLQEIGGGRIASIIGRYYAMDRDHRWPRVQSAYELITEGKGEFQATDALTALEMAYARNETDEFIKATAITPEDSIPVRIEDGDVVVVMNYRSDRARQITRAFIEDGFDGFERAYRPQVAQFVTLTEYHADWPVQVAFPPERLQNGFGEYISSLGLHQLRIAETEKYAHVTFFFNGGREEPFAWEERILIPSPQVDTYDEKPEMSALELTDTLIKMIEGNKYDTIICNFANPDMVGHTGKIDATVKALETVDDCLGRIVFATTMSGGELLITADHGNAEKMEDPITHQPHTAHTTNPVPLIYVGERDFTFNGTGVLADIAPTMLFMMGLEKPDEMLGHSLLNTGNAVAEGEGE